jgi:hypothetical protein
LKGFAGYPQLAGLSSASIWRPTAAFGGVGRARIEKQAHALAAQMFSFGFIERELPPR